MAAADSNIVGYTTKSVAANKKILSGAQFVEVGSNALDITSIKMNAGVPAGGTIFIDWWNGSAFERAAWVDEVNDIPNNFGWGNVATWAAVKHTFAPGEGFWIQVPGNATTAKVTQSGEVVLSPLATYDFNLASTKKYMFINPLPTTVTLSDVKMSGVPSGGTVFIDWWNGSAYERAAWVDEVNDIPNNFGWGNVATWAAVSHTFDVNEGFWIILPATGATPQVKIVNQVPSPL